MGSLLTSDPDKALEFCDFYKTLYTAQSPTSRTQQVFLDRVTLPSPTEAQSQLIDQPITAEEILGAIKSLKPNKVPGPDGYTAQFYKTFASKLAPHLAALFNACTQAGEVSRSMGEALITVLPKPGKDPLFCSSYRPISLIFSCQSGGKSPIT